MFYGNNRDALRRQYVDAWKKDRDGKPLSPLEAQIVDILRAHPEYHELVASPDALNQEFTPEGGQLNPFLHLSLHLAVRDQIATDRPAGIRALFERSRARLGDAHEAEHVFLECLGETLFEAQQAGRMPDEAAYLERVRSATTRPS